MKIHTLKITSDNFTNVITGLMSFQLRKDDRNYSKGDVLNLCEVDKDIVCTGRVQVCKVSHILTEADGLQKGYVLLNIKRLAGHISPKGRFMTNV